MGSAGPKRSDVVVELPTDARQPPQGGGGPGETDNREPLYIEPGRRPFVVDEMEDRLASAETGIKVHGGRLVRLMPQRQKTRGIHRPEGSLIIHPLEAVHLAEVAGRYCCALKFDGRASAWRETDIPRSLADALLARGTWQFPELLGVIEAPTIRPDGVVVDSRGYDDESGLYLAGEPPDGYRRPAETPTDGDVYWARERLQEIVSTFPFVSDSDLAAAVAGILTALVRRLLPAAPLTLIIAPTPGTGKSLLTDLIAVVALGRRATVLSLGDDDAEAAKRLGGVLLAGDQVVVMDNIERPLKGDLLCQVLTQPSLRLRPLGGSSMVSVPTNSTLIANGNNVQVIGDLRRRVMLIRLDAGIERPETREFEGAPLDHIARQRGEIITAALTIIRGYQAAGEPAIDAAPYGGFDEWDRLVRRPLIWAGLADPLEASEGLREQDPDLEATRALFAAWRSIFGDRPVTAAEVAQEANRAAPRFDDDALPDSPELVQALQVICAEKITSRRLGNWLRRHRDRVIDGLRLQRAGDDTDAKVARWRIIHAQ